MSSCSLPGQAPPASELGCRAALWKLLCSRRDIDSVTLELLGRHYADQSLPGGLASGGANCSAFSLACSLEMIFDLQRTHLQSRTPYGAWGQLADSVYQCVVERLPYLLSLKTAKDAFACLSKEAMAYLETCNGYRDDITSLGRIAVVRALVSGTRMLCLHPDIESGDTSLAPLSLRIGQQFDPWEQFLLKACNRALYEVPDKHQGLELPRMGFGRNMFPLDNEMLLRAARSYINNFTDDPQGGYWALYDISWSIVAAFIQCLAAKANLKAQNFVGLAIDIAEDATAEACKVPKDATMCALLLDIVEVLRPVLMTRGDGEESWQVSYSRTLGEIFPSRPPVFRVYRDCISQEIVVLRTFEGTLKQRQFSIRDCDGELSSLLSRLENACSAAVDAQNGHLSSMTFGKLDSRPTEILKLYLINCDEEHIIAENHTFMSWLRDESRGFIQQSEGSYIVGEERCPFCTSDGAFTRLQEILPVNNMLDVVSQKRKELEAHQIRRLKAFSLTEGSTPSSKTDEDEITHDGYFSPYSSPPSGSGLHTRSPLGSSSSLESSTLPEVVSQAALCLSSPLSEITSRVVTPLVSPTSPASPRNLPKLVGGSRGFMGRFRKASAGASSVELSITPPARSNTLNRTISLEQLGQGKKSVTLSPDFERMVFWTKKSLAWCNASDTILNLIPMEGSDLVIASRIYCIIVRRHADKDEIRWYNFDQGFDRPIHEVLFSQKATPDMVQCVAIDPDEIHLAVGLKGGTVQLFQLQQPFDPQILNFQISGCDNPTVASLSFTADTGELVASIRADRLIYIFSCPKPFTSPSIFYTHDIGSQENDNQGVSTVIRSSNRNLLCVTSWTIQGTPILRDCTKKINRPLKRSKLIGAADINNRTQQAAFSKSGRVLILVDAAGGIFKIFPNTIDKVRAERITRSPRLWWKAQSIGNPQLLDMKISDDEEHVRVVWVDEKKNQAQLITAPINTSG